MGLHERVAKHPAAGGGVKFCEGWGQAAALALLQLHDCDRGCFVFIVGVSLRLGGAEVNAGAEGSWSARVRCVVLAVAYDTAVFGCMPRV